MAQSCLRPQGGWCQTSSLTCLAVFIFLWRIWVVFRLEIMFGLLRVLCGLKEEFCWSNQMWIFRVLDWKKKGSVFRAFSEWTKGKISIRHSNQKTRRKNEVPTESLMLTQMNELFALIPNGPWGKSPWPLWEIGQIKAIFLMEISKNDVKPWRTTTQ